MNTVQLECFLAVAEHLSFAKAAHQMNLSQPAVTHQIQSLESELGATLFYRTTRSVELTPEGLTFLEDARHIVSATYHARNRFRNPDSQDIQMLSIGCSSYSELELLPDVLRRLAELHPNVHPNVVTLPSSQLLARTEEGTIDVALGIREHSGKKSSLQYRELCKTLLVGIFREDHPLAGQDAICTGDVQQHNLILYHPNSAAPDVARLQWTLSKGKSSSHLYFCESTESAILLADAGFGVAVLPDIFVPPHDRLQKYALADTEPLSFGVYYQSVQDHPLRKDFIRLMKQSMTQTPT